MSHLNAKAWAHRPLCVIEAHNALSALIGVEAGFQAIWCSGLTISAALGLRDCQEASLGDTLQVVQSIGEAVEAPLIVDGDNGYGDFNIARLFARRLSRLGAAAVCLEDKQFPKRNSFLDAPHDLLDVATYQGVVRACKDAQDHADFWVVARTEALIAGRTVAEALDRAHAYVDAGADAVFIHSRQRDGAEVLDFARRWDRRAPLFIAPTTYAQVGLETFGAAGVDVVIWANHLLRASIQAMRAAAHEIASSASVVSMEPKIATVEDIFTLTRTEALAADALRLTRAEPEPLRV